MGCNSEGEVLLLKRLTRDEALVLTLALCCWLVLGGLQVLAEETPATPHEGVKFMDAFPLGELRPGMKGTGKTVAMGTKIEDFQVWYRSVAMLSTAWAVSPPVCPVALCTLMASSWEPSATLLI